MPKEVIPKELAVVDFPVNLVTLVGTLNRPPQMRVLKTGTQVINLDVAVKTDDGVRQVLPVSWFDAPTWAYELEEGVELVVVGRMRRQWFANKANFTDVVAEHVVRRKAHARVRRVLGDAMAQLQEAAQ